ncbi:MAG: YciI family protein [Paraburkholderia sp.]|uniref:YciI family protein n=1 Tax=Paraburkholderia sp. TaxID=1926495 RepID=UPI003C4FAD2D
MYIVNLSYLKSLDHIQLQLDAHLRFLDDQYERGVFLASGPKNPRDGGVFLVRGTITRTELDELLTYDPFFQAGLAKYSVIEFAPVKHHAALAGIL